MNDKATKVRAAPATGGPSRTGKSGARRQTAFGKADALVARIVAAAGDGRAPDARTEKGQFPGMPGCARSNGLNSRLCPLIDGYSRVFPPLRKKQKEGACRTGSEPDGQSGGD